MAPNSKYNQVHKHRFVTGLILLIYSVCYLIFDLYLNYSTLQPIFDVHNLYLASFTLIAISVFLSLFITNNDANNAKPSKSITSIHIFVSTLMIIGGLLYLTLTLLQSISHFEYTHYTESNDILYSYALLNISAAFFVCSNAIVLGLMTLLHYHLSHTLIFINALIFIITSTGMAFFWSAYYNYSIVSPTQTFIFGCIQTGWILIFTVSLGTLIYEASKSKHNTLLKIFCVLLMIGGLLVFAGSSVFNAGVIFTIKDVNNYMELGVEWILSLCVFIACIACSVLFIRSTNSQHLVYINQQKKLKHLQTSNVLNTIDIVLETEPRREPLWADV